VGAGFAALLPDGCRRALCRFPVAVYDDDLGATPGKCQCGGPADAVAGPGDQRDLAVEIHGVPPRVPGSFFREAK
jgi:hypothetical protein